MLQAPYLIGAEVATSAAKVLLPAAFALASGVLRGTTVVKKLLPYSRIPGVMLIGTTVFLLPFFAVISAIVVQCTGDDMACAGANLVLASYALHVSIGKFVVPPQSHEKANNVLFRTGLVASLLSTSGYVCIVMAVLKSPMLYSYLTDPMYVARIIASFLGKRMLSLLCVTDALLDVCTYLDQAERHDSNEVALLRESNMQALSCLSYSTDLEVQQLATTTSTYEVVDAH